MLPMNPCTHWRSNTASGKQRNIWNVFVLYWCTLALLLLHHWKFANPPYGQNNPSHKSLCRSLKCYCLPPGCPWNFQTYKEVMEDQNNVTFIGNGARKELNNWKAGTHFVYGCQGTGVPVRVHNLHRAANYYVLAIILQLLWGQNYAFPLKYVMKASVQR